MAVTNTIHRREHIFCELASQISSKCGTNGNNSINVRATYWKQPTTSNPPIPNPCDKPMHTNFTQKPTHARCEMQKHHQMKTHFKLKTPATVHCKLANHIFHGAAQCMEQYNITNINAHNQSKPRTTTAPKYPQRIYPAYMTRTRTPRGTHSTSSRLCSTTLLKCK